MREQSKVYGGEARHWDRGEKKPGIVLESTGSGSRSRSHAHTKYARAHSVIYRVYWLRSRDARTRLGSTRMSDSPYAARARGRVVLAVS